MSGLNDKLLLLLGRLLQLYLIKLMSSMVSSINSHVPNRKYRLQYKDYKITNHTRKRRRRIFSCVLLVHYEFYTLSLLGRLGPFPPCVRTLFLMPAFPCPGTLFHWALTLLFPQRTLLGLRFSLHGL